MKRQYISPSMLVVKLEMRSALMDNLSFDPDKQIEITPENEGDYGLTREDDSNGGNIWDNAW